MPTSTAGEPLPEVPRALPGPAEHPRTSAGTVVESVGVPSRCRPGEVPVHEHDATASRPLAVIDRNLDWVAACYGMR